MVVRSLAVEVVEVDGQYMANAPWLSEPVTGSTQLEAFTKAMLSPKGARERAPDRG